MTNDEQQQVNARIAELLAPSKGWAEVVIDAPDPEFTNRREWETSYIVTSADLRTREWWPIPDYCGSLDTALAEFPRPALVELMDDWMSVTVDGHYYSGATAGHVLLAYLESQVKP